MAPEKGAGDVQKANVLGRVTNLPGRISLPRAAAR